jgi:hypothetical protein
MNEPFRTVSLSLSVASYTPLGLDEALLSFAAPRPCRIQENSELEDDEVTANDLR